MSEVSADDRRYRRELTIALVSVLVGSLITILGQPYAEAFLEERESPVLRKEIYRPSLASLPQHVQDQIEIMPARYSLKHESGRAAKGVTIIVKSDADLESDKVVFDPTSESYNIFQDDPKTFRVNLNEIRPGGGISFELLVSPADKVEWKELVTHGRVANKESLERANSDWWPYAILAIVLLAIVIAAFYFVFIGQKAVSGLLLIEQGAESFDPERRSRFAHLLVVVLVYNAVAQIGFANLSLPSIPVRDAFYCILLYLAITNFGVLSLVVRSLDNVIKGRSTVTDEVPPDRAGGSNAS